MKQPLLAACAIVFSAVFLVALVTPLRAATCPDLPGFSALEGFPVYDGACLFGAQDPGFTRHDLPTGPIKGRVLSASIPLEGTLQRRLYVAPEGASPTDVITNYRDALVGLGYQVLFDCAGRACGSNNALLGKLVILPKERALTNLGRASEFAMYIDGDEQFLAARSPDGTRHIAVYAARNQSTQIVGAAAGRAAVHIDLVTTQTLEARMIDAAAMAKGLSDEGHVAVDNIYFQFGTADLAPESAPALAEMVRLLTTRPTLKVFVVGHTDWVGNAEANLALSQRRAGSVVAALVKGGIAPDRVTPAGAGLFSPRASNTTEAGRALNRRVELVER